MPTRKPIQRILKFLGKVALCLLILLFSFILIIHIPSVQNRIAHRLLNTLSTALNAHIELKNMKFSLLGSVKMEELQVWDPDSNLVFTIGKMDVVSNIFDLVTGDYLFDELRLENVKGHLIQSKDGLNIQFILAAFEPKDKLNITPDTAVKDFKFHFKRIILQNIAIDFISTVSGTNVAIDLGNASSENAEYSTHDNLISADELCFGQLAIQIVTRDQTDTVNAPLSSLVENVFIPDFSTGLGLEIKDFEITNSDFAFHRDSAKNTAKFDPDHVDLRNIQINLSDVMMHPDTLSATLHTISTQLSGFPPILAGADVKINRHQLALSALHISSDSNEVHADLTAVYNPLSTRPDVPDITFIAQAKINPDDLSYFLNDTMTKNFNQWKTTELTIDGNYVDGKGNLKTLKVKTTNSQLTAAGMLEDILSPENISWNNLAINASIGSDFKSLMSPFLSNIKIPPSIKVQMISNGNPKRIFIDGKMNTTWGNVKAKGTALPMGSTIGIDMSLTGENVLLGEMMDLPWLGPMNMNATAKGKLGTHQDAQIDGVISSINFMEQPIHQIAFQSRIAKENIDANFQIEDPRFRLNGHSNISFAGPMLINSQFHFDTFQLGRLVPLDSTLSLSGDLLADITINGSTIAGKLNGKTFYITNQYTSYTLDTLALAVNLSPTSSSFEYLTDEGKGNLTANFDLQEIPNLLQPWMKNILYPSSKIQLPDGNRTLEFDLQFNNPAPLQLLGIHVDEFSAIHAVGQLNEQVHSIDLKINSGEFKGYALSFDTLSADLTMLGDSIGGRMNGSHIFYNTFDLGNLNFYALTEQDTLKADLEMMHDSVSYLGIGMRILRTDGGANFYPGKLSAFNKDYHFDPNNPIFINDSNVVVNQFQITHDSMQLGLTGDLHAFTANFSNLDLTQFNLLVSSGEPVVNKGVLNGTLLYASGKQIDFKAKIDSLVLYHSVPLTVTFSAVKDHDQLPFEFMLSNETNQVDAHGKYFLNDKSVDASLFLDVNNPELFAFLYTDYLQELKGSIKGNATLHGPIKKPGIKGALQFHDVHFTTTAPELTFNIKDDSIKLDNEGLTLNQFKLYDQKLHPLIISGKVVTKDYPSYTYDLKIKADDFALIDQPNNSNGALKGLLVLDSDIALSGTDKDTYVKADIKVKNNTNLIYVMTSEDDVLLNTIGIVDFVDPGQLNDTTQLNNNETAYDSIIASLPDFNLSSIITIQDSATLKVITDAQSGDYFQASGGARLEVEYDRTGNPQVSGTYTINKGLYRMSFYDLVKKSFTLVKGSSINWSGSPESGEMDIKATYTVATNSIGLIGHEIGENEKAIYKRSLDYIVGINIKGTLEKPVITFSLDLPKEDKTSYPVLANKLERLRLPEFQTELNKQVFGLLVLGGFMPETSVADIDQSQVATTAIYNSVNALLASQVNRFASQYVKGVNIDVGIQSYADYSTPGGKTQTAMDFRVSKSIFNERLSFEVGGDFDINSDQTGTNKGDNYRGDVAIIYDLTGNGDKQLKLFNNESYDIIYQEIRNTGISLIFIREFNKGDITEAKAKKQAKAEKEAEDKEKKKVQ